MTGPVRVAALYRFARFPDPAALKPPLEALCRTSDIRGTLLLASEGINGTIAGTPQGLEAVIAYIRELPDCAGLEVKWSDAPAMPFHRMKVRLKREIVTMGVADIDPLASVGTYVAPEDWNALIADPETILIDTRNDYEVAIGSFEGAINPETPSFSDFPAWFRRQREHLLGDGKTPRVAMFCTGGIRCEKATAFLKSEGVDAVFHLKGGILDYLERVPEADSRWRGECFVFDQRVAVTHGLKQGSHTVCHACRTPVSEADRVSASYEEGVSCPACNAQTSDAKRASVRERHRQERMAAARGEAHVGATMPRTHSPCDMRAGQGWTEDSEKP